MDIKRNVKDFEEALKGLDFPASRSAIINKVRDRGGIDGHVVEVAEQLPGRTYDWEQDAVREFERALQEHARVVDVPGVPAAKDESPGQRSSTPLPDVGLRGIADLDR
jgi:hypothetical protein